MTIFVAYPHLEPAVDVRPLLDGLLDLAQSLCRIVHAVLGDVRQTVEVLQVDDVALQLLRSAAIVLERNLDVLVDPRGNGSDVIRYRHASTSAGSQAR